MTRTANTTPAVRGSLQRALRAGGGVAGRRVSARALERRASKPRNPYVSRGCPAV